MDTSDLSLFQDGETFHGYRVERLLGNGGAGAVYLVKHEMLDTYYALKILNPSVAARDSDQVKRFLREARIATRIRHPNLVAVHDCGYDREKNAYYLVMDYVTGGSLRSMLAFEGAIPLGRAVEIVTQVVRALKAAQAFDVVHRDIKPENIMIQPDGLVKLVDLGIAKARGLGDAVRTNTDRTFGTPAYVSPEQAVSAAQVDRRADIYSLGIVFFEMVTGRCPYRGRNAAEVLSQILSDDPTPDIRDVNQDLPADLAILIRRMTIKELNRRMSSYDDVLQGLSQLGYATVRFDGPSSEYAPQPEKGMKTILEELNVTTPQDGGKPSSAGGRWNPMNWFRHRS